MGFLDTIKSVFSKDKVKEFNEQSEVIYGPGKIFNMEVGNKLYSLDRFNLMPSNEVPDPSKDVYIVNCIETNPEYTVIDDPFAPEDKTFISFDVPKGFLLTKDVLETIIMNYCARTQEGNRPSVAYLGSFDKIDGQAQQIGYNQFIQDFTYRKSEAIRGQNLRNAERLVQEKKAADLREMKRIDYESQKRVARDRNVKEQAKLNTYFKMEKRAYGQEYFFEGRDVRTGGVVRLSGLRKYKNEEGTYLYVAYKNNLSNHSDHEFFDKEGGRYAGYPVAFESDFRLEDTAQGQYPQAVQGLLELLSNQELQGDINQRDKMNFIGKLDRNGVYQRNTTPQSSILASRFYQLKNEYDSRLINSKEKSQNQNNYGFAR